MQSDEVLAFLDGHPDFLMHHAERFGLHPAKLQQDRVVVSFAERQLLELKDLNRQLEARLQQLVEHGENNDLLLSRLHQMTLALLACRTLGHALDTVRESFAEQYQLDRVAIRLWHPGAEQHDAVYNSRNEVQALARNLNAPYCGPYVNDEVLSWFPSKPVLQSFAQIALRNRAGEAFGILVLATDDAHRFTYDMHTQYLTRIGELVSATLLRTLED